MPLEPTNRSLTPTPDAHPRPHAPRGGSHAQRVFAWLGLSATGFFLVVLLAASGCAVFHRKASAPGSSTAATQAATYTPPPVAEITQWPYAEPAGVPDGWKVKKLVKEVTFAAGDAALGAEARGALREAVREAAGNTQWGFLAVGFTDNREEEPRAVKLGLARAKAVSGFLRSLGVGADRLAVMNLGSRYAKAGEFEPRQLAHDRRVEVWAFRK